MITAVNFPGNIPSEIGALTALVVLSLGTNRFSGKMYVCVNQVPRINAITIRIESCVCVMMFRVVFEHPHSHYMMYVLHVLFARCFGRLPFEFGQFGHMLVFNIGSNRLYG